jgi:hypothetical protein
MGESPHISGKAWPAGWEDHRREQNLFIARNTTPEQRFRWLQDMLNLLRPQLPELLRNRELAKRKEEKARVEARSREANE